jgi:4-carboxymuconolactone decarboxylase
MWHMTARLREKMKPGFLAILLLLVLVARMNVGAQERLAPIPDAEMTEAQKKAVAEYKLARPSGPNGFWWLYLRIPEVTIPFLRIQEHVHMNSRLGERLTHFAILIAAKQWNQEYIWSSHYDPAIKSGLKVETLKSLAEGRRPEHMAEDEDLLYDFSIELQRNQSVSDATYARALAKFGEGGIADATLIQGEYTLMSMIMNLQRTPTAPGWKPLLSHYPR